ncbi:hypothetical protein ANAEL_02778 [Anaerolineales bacterium]|nr:hypothetical protein ANAEL_02778 [Anaerolineales bacterium]
MSPSPNDFYSAMSQVAVSLLALLFVSFQIAHSRWVGRPARQYLAIQTSLPVSPVIATMEIYKPRRRK